MLLNIYRSHASYFCRRCVYLGFLLIVGSLQAQTTVIKAGHLFDSKAGKFLKDQVVIVEGRKITKVGSGLRYASDAKVIDLSNSWVLPGLMDCHVHIGKNLVYRKMAFTENIVLESTSLLSLRGSVVATQFLESGFTTIKEIGNDGNYATADVIRAIKYGWIQGPDIVYAGKIIAPFGGQSSGINPEHEGYWHYEYLDADTPDEVVKAVRKNIYYGATVIKMVTGDNGIYDVEDIRAAVDEAKKYGMKVTVHALRGVAATNAIQAGIAAIEHGFELDNTQLQLMKDEGVFLVGTDFAFDNWYAYGMDSLLAVKLEGVVVDRLERAYKIGTKMAFGTDIIIDIPGLNRVQTSLKVLQTWKKAKIPAAYILQTMTINAAELLGLEKSAGLIAPEFQADIIALDRSPLEDIDAVKSVSFVMKSGDVIRQQN